MSLLHLEQDLGISLQYADAAGTLVSYPFFLQEVHNNPNLTRKQIYAVYLHTNRWRDLRQDAMTRDQFVCRLCSQPATEVHHRRYPQQLGTEPVEWLTSLCSACHRFQHCPPELEELRKSLRESCVGKKVVCPLCEYRVEEYIRSLHSGVGRTLIGAYRLSCHSSREGDWVKLRPLLIESDFVDDSFDWSLLKHWGFLEGCPFKRSQGWWRVTPHGAAFVLGEVKVHKQAHVYNSRLQKMAGDLVDIFEVLGKRYDHHELLTAWEIPVVEEVAVHKLGSAFFIPYAEEEVESTEADS